MLVLPKLNLEIGKLYLIKKDMPFAWQEHPDLIHSVVGKIVLFLEEEDLNYDYEYNHHFLYINSKLEVRFRRGSPYDNCLDTFYQLITPTTFQTDE